MFLGDWGRAFRANIKVIDNSGVAQILDLSGKTVEFLFYRPSGDIASVEAIVTRPKKGVAYYNIPEGFIDQIGVWHWQTRVTDATSQFHTDQQDFTVEAHLTETA